ncbi:histidine--tRNA ligase [Paenibacillus tarimensis]
MQNVKGTFDYYGKEQAIRRKVQTLLRETFELYGFEEMEATVLNELDLLNSKYAGGDEIVKEMYQLTDQGKRRLGLRYDLTIPFAKVIALNPGIELPYKRYEIGKVFRDGPVKRGRLREFLQCDVDTVGVAGAEAEAELMQLAAQVFRSLEIPIIVRWNNRRFLGELLESIGVPACELLSVMLTLDKLAKIGQEGVGEELLGKGIGTETTASILELIEMEKPSIEQLSDKHRTGNYPGAVEVRALQEIIEKIGLADTCIFDPFLSRGLSFYTGTVYEIFDATNAYTSSLGGGGRYDAIIGQLVGRDDIRYPTVGLSFGMESMIQMIGNREVEQSSVVSVVVISIGNVIPDVLNIAAELRACGIRTGMDTSGRKLKRSLAAASIQGIRFVLLAGEDEVRLGKVRLKDMEEMTESVLTVQEAIYRIERVVGG